MSAVEQPGTRSARPTGGERQDLDAFIADHRQPLIAYLQNQTNDPTLAQDLAHDAMERLIERWDQVSAMEHPWRWLRTVAKNLAISNWRRRMSAGRAVETLGHRRQDQHDASGLVDVLDLLDGLSDRQQRVVFLRHRLHLSVAETSEVLGWSPGTVKSTSSRALRVLRAEGTDQRFSNQDLSNR